MQPSLQVISLKQITTTKRNPRCDLADDDEGIEQFAQHLANGREPHLVQPPIVVEETAGMYRIVAGERRIRAARAAGWTTVACLVHPAATLSPLIEFQLRSYENFHRQDLHPLDRAATLHIERAIELARALGCENEAYALLEQEQLPLSTVQALNDLLATHGFQPTHPPVTWEQVLNRLGLAMSTDQRKRLVRLLTLNPVIMERLRALDLSEASLRSLGQLEPADQEAVVAALEADPTLARRLRRISRAVRDQDYTIDEALSEARGVVLTDEADRDTDDDEADEGDGNGNTNEVNQGSDKKGKGNGDNPAPDDTASDQPDDTVMEHVTMLLDLSNQIATTLEALSSAMGGRVLDLSEPWRDYVAVALDTIQDSLEAIGRR
jgi:ParB-like chromosome segregation protein Spo0J